MPGQLEETERLARLLRGHHSVEAFVERFGQPNHWINVEKMSWLYAQLDASGPKTDAPRLRQQLSYERLSSSHVVTVCELLDGGLYFAYTLKDENQPP